MAFSFPPPNQPGFFPPQCSECGIPLRSPSKTALCPLCHKPLCERCNRSGLCPAHYSILAPEDREKIDAIDLKIKSNKKMATILSILPMGVFLPLLIIILSGAFDDVLQEAAQLPFFFLILCCPGFGLSNGVRRKIVLLNQERDVILAAYQDVDISSVPHPIPPIEPYQQPESRTTSYSNPPQSSDPIISAEEITADGKFCRNCRNSNPLSAQFCIKCGKRL